MKSGASILFLCLTYFWCMAAASNTDTRQAIFEPRFQTLKVSHSDNFMLTPVIGLDSDERVIISFDEISDDRSYLRARLIHCNADWSPSNLLDSEYIDGFNEIAIDDYAFSQNTFMHYVNYRLEIPSGDMKITRSGNYLLQVYDEDSPDDVLLQARLAVSERRSDIDGFVSGRTDRGYNDELQQLEFRFSQSDFKARDVFSDLLVEVSLNGNPESQRILTRPSRISGDMLVYEHQGDMIFPAGNEFRRFETVRATYPGLGVDSVRFGDKLYHAYLKRDIPRVSSNYEYDRTQHGRFLVRESNSTDSDLGADYIMVHFRLNAPEYTGADIYVDGEFTRHDFSRDSPYKMKYDRETGAYILTAPLKQGSYNYRYVAKARGTEDATVDSGVIEGDFYETRNEYRIKVFYREPGSRGDRLIADKIILSY